MGASLRQQRRVSDDALRGVKLCRRGRRPGGEEPAGMTVPLEEAPANSVPAAAVRRRGQALFGMIGRKAPVGGAASGA
jgi:hypothetical protein